MRTTTQKFQQIRKIISFVLRIVKLAKCEFSLGLTLKQWVASFVICLMLMPIFSIPAGATLVLPAIDPTVAQFEAANPELPIWKKLKIDLSARIEAWVSSRNEINVVSVPTDTGDETNPEKDKRTDKKTKPKKAAKTKAGPLDTKASSESVDKINEDILINGSDAKSSTPNLTETKTATSSTIPKNSSFATTLFLNQLPESEKDSVYDYENNLGSPPGQTEKDSSHEAAALRIKHRVGIANFNFGVALAGLSGRGIDAGIGMTYNSRIWNKSLNASNQDHFTYDVEESWIAPGFSSGNGYLETRAVVTSTHPTSNTGVFTYYTAIIPAGLTDSDGTRHQLGCSEFTPISGTYESYCSGYTSTDGTFIKMPGRTWTANPGNSQSVNTANYSSASFTATYKNGSKIQFSGGFGSGNDRKHYPLMIQDSNGNRIRITYKADQSGRIDYIRDTLNRDIKFYYENNVSGNPDKLVAVTIPGMSSPNEIQTVRFYYEDMTLQSGGFVSSAQVSAPPTIRVLKFVYMPATKTGYEYEYHPKYGMIKKITRRAGMNASTTATNITGTLSGGTFAASTEYDYPDGNTPQSDVPKYTKRTDDWQGRTAASPQETFYDVPTPTGTFQDSNISVMDKEYDIATGNSSDFEIRTNTKSDINTGLLSETSVTKIYGPSLQYSRLMSKTEFGWTGRDLTTLKVTNDSGLVKNTEFEYDGYKNQKLIREYEYGTNSPALLRTTEILYETGSGWIDNSLFSLPKSVKTTVGGTTVSKTLYEYDNNGTDNLLNRGDIGTTGTHDTTYNPNYPAWDEEICPDGIPSGQSAIPGGCVIYHHPGWSAASAYRGNVTKVGRMLDVNAATITTTNSHKTDYNYDILGNLISATLSCCQLKTIDYGTTFSETGYAFPTKETKGTGSTQLVSEASYNIRTGLVMSSKNENEQTTSYEYEADTLRPKKTIYPNGGYVESDYGDKLAPGTLPGFVRTTTTLDTNKTAQSYSYFDGRGQGLRSATQTPDGWSVSAVEFDKLGRPFKSYNPFYASTPNGAVPGGTKFTEVLNYDALGRTTSVRLQDLTTVSTEFSKQSTIPSGFNKTFVTVTDQAGKQRRQIADSLERIVRVDEPDASGNLGAVDNPNQPTSYEYDANDNLAKVIQTDGAVTQERKFKYDSLSRLTHEKQVEAIPTLDNNGVKGAPDPNKWTKVLKYNADGLLEDGYDANGVNTHFAYDGLNRISSVTFIGETAFQTPAINYTYDEIRASFYNKGQLTKVTTAAVAGAQATPATEQVFDFDKMGRVVKHQQKIDAQSYLLEYGYNLAGQLVSEKYPSGKIVNIGYDANGRLSTVADSARTFLNGISFNSQTLPSQMSFGNGTNQNFGFNDRLQMISQELKRGSEVVQKYDYNYGELDANNQLKNNGKLEQVVSHIGAEKQWTQKFKYDSIGRLSEAAEFRGDNSGLSYKQKFDFDKFGNLYRKQTSNPAGQLTPLPTTWIEENEIDKNTNRFTSTTGTTYNDAGQVVTDNKFRQMSFGYDANGRMVKATKANAPDALSVYDSLGNRVATKVNDVWQFVIYDAFGKLVAEYGGMSATDEGGVKYVLSDWQGSVRASLSNSGYVKSRTDYQAFGEEIQSGIGMRSSAQGFGGGTGTRQGYGLTEKDEASGLNHTWFRKNENRAGRWTSPDPYNGSAIPGNPQSFNRYSYVENQPTNFVDPSGLLRIQQCTRTWVDYGDGGGRHYSSWTCVTIYDDEGGGTLDNREYSNCVLNVSKSFGDIKLPSQEKLNAFTLAKKQLLDKYHFGKGQANESDAVAAGTVIVGAAAGYLIESVAIGALAGPLGAAIGAIVGLGAVAVFSLHASRQAENAFRFDAKQIAEAHPEAAEFFSKAAAELEEKRRLCDKYLKA